MERFFDWFQLAALAGLTCLGLGRALRLHARGVRVVVADRERSLLRALCDLLFAIFFFVWAYEIVAYAWPLRVHVVPRILGSRVVDIAVLEPLGALVVTLGLVIYGLALRAFGDSWRLGIDRDKPGALVTGGIFAWSRNPVYLGLDLVTAGMFLLQGRWLTLCFALAMVAVTHDAVRREERFLAELYGDAYRDYAARVRRYLGRRGPARDG